jgi:hypothetical protein
MVYDHSKRTHIPYPTTRPPAPRRSLARCSPRPRPRRWACSGGLAMTALITSARCRCLPSHASDQHRSWSVTPGIRPAVTLAYSATHDGGGGCSVNPRPHPCPQLHCPAPSPWRSHRTVGCQVLGGAGKRAHEQGRRHPRMGKTLPRI